MLQQVRKRPCTKLEVPNTGQSEFFPPATNILTSFLTVVLRQFHAPPYKPLGEHCTVDYQVSEMTPFDEVCSFTPGLRFLSAYSR